jgi:lipopolysaccharide export system permease protein
MNEYTRTGYRLDTTLSFYPSEFNRRSNIIETMDSPELNKYIEEETRRGSEEIPLFLIEKHRRTSIPYATFVLTVIGVSMSSKKVRGGIGVQLGFGILLSFTYIMFMQISQTFATNGSLPPLLAVWLPNLLYTVIALYLLRKAMK